MRETIRVLLVDDHKLTCTAVRAVLLGAVDILLLDEITTPTNLQELCTQYKPDVLLLSLETLEKFSLSLDSIRPERKILLVTNCINTSCSELTKNNVLGCLLREQIPNELVPAIHSITAGIHCYSQPIAKQLLQLPNLQMLEDMLISLTTKEKQALRLLTKGKTNKEIGFLLGISISTVEYHLSNIYKKLDVNSRTEAAVLFSMHQL